MKHSADYPLASRPVMGFADEYRAVRTAIFCG